MILFRFTGKEYANLLDGEGSRIYGGRWNSPGLPVIYTSTSISLSLLELLIYQSSYEELQTNYLLRIEVADVYFSRSREITVKPDWQNDTGYTRFIGDSYLRDKSSLLLRVPSAIIPEETNVLINPLHRDFGKVIIRAANPFAFDSRLFK